MIGDNDEVVASQRIDLHHFLMYRPTEADILNVMFAVSHVSSARVTRILFSAVIAALIAGCGGDVNVAPSTAISTADVERNQRAPIVIEPTEVGISPVESSIVIEPAAAPDTEPAAPSEDDSALSGELALYFRVNFGSETESLKNSGGDISWESGSRGIVRYIPSTGESTVIKSIRTTSFSKSSIYPITVEGRLYVVRDWGSDWTIDNQRFTIEELDPISGSVLFGGSISAEWFTIAGDQVFYISAVIRDLFGNATGGGKQMVLDLTTGSVRELDQADRRLRYVANSLVSLDGQSVRSHSILTGAVESSTQYDGPLLADVWPHSERVFQGDSAVYWAADIALPDLAVIAAYPDGSIAQVLTFDPESDVDLALDEHDGLLLIGGIDNSGRRGLGITSLSTFDLSTGEVNEIPIDQFIGSARAEAGGGIQLLRLP